MRWVFRLKQGEMRKKSGRPPNPNSNNSGSKYRELLGCECFPALSLTLSLSTVGACRAINCIRRAAKGIALLFLVQPFGNLNVMRYIQIF